MGIRKENATAKALRRKEKIDGNKKGKYLWWTHKTGHLLRV